MMQRPGEKVSNEEQIISGCPIDGAISVLGIAGSEVISGLFNAFVASCILDTNIALWATRTASAPSILLVLLEPYSLKVGFFQLVRGYINLWHRSVVEVM